jgi:hypothetical protein
LARLGDSQVSLFELEKQTVGWVDQHMPARFGEPILLARRLGLAVCAIAQA